MLDKAKWPADKVERRAISKLTPDERNARTHSSEQTDQIAASIQEWGWTIPILVDERDTIIAGHGRYEAAKRMGLTDVPVIVARGWSEEQKRAYRLADNKLGENSSWQDDLLGAEVFDLEAAGFDVSLIGLSDKELERMRGEDEAIEVKKVDTSLVEDEFWVSIRGPLQHQADVLDKLKAATKDMDGVNVDMGVIKW